MEMVRPVIIGAGVSGLSAANYFVDNNISPIIIDGNAVGQIKVCGEFFSAEAIPFLEKWEIPFSFVKKGNFFTKSNKYSVNFRTWPVTTSRSLCEIKLAERAISYDASIYSNSLVEDIIPAKTKTDLHCVKLTTGQIFETNKLIITTSGLPFLKSKQLIKPTYVGIKAHFNNFNIPNELNMYLIDDAYMGVTKIDESTVNVCCLANKKLVDSYESVDQFINYFMSLHPQLNKLYDRANMKNDKWLIASISKFGKKYIPNWPNCYFIGDAAATIFPASGNGLAMGLTAGVMAAHHVVYDLKSCFKTDWKRRYAKRLGYSKLLNSVFMSNKKADISFKLIEKFPFIFNYFYKITRDRI